MRNRILIAVILLVVAAISFFDWLVAGLQMPVVLYALPLLAAAYYLPPVTVAIIAGIALVMYLVAAPSHADPLWAVGLRSIGLLVIGFFAVVLAQKTRREAALTARAEALAGEKSAFADTMQTLINTMPAGVLVSDAGGTIIMSNPAARDLLGGAAAGQVADPERCKILYRRDGTPFPPNELPLARAQARGETVKDVEIIVRREGESERVILSSSAPVVNALEYVTGAVGVFQDITARWLAEATLQVELEARRELESIVNRSPAVAFLWRATKGWPVEFVSDNVEQFGYRLEDFISGRVPYHSIVHPDDLPKLVSELSSLIGEGETEFHQHYRILTKAGEVRWVEARSWAGRTEGKRITHFQGIVLDITERVRAEDALRQSQQRFRSLVECADTMIYRLELLPSPHFSYVSPTAKALLGYQPDDFYADPGLPRKVVHPEDLPALEAVAADPVAEATVTFRARRADGSLVWIEQRNVAVYDSSGAIVAYEGIMRDVTGRRQRGGG